MSQLFYLPFNPVFNSRGLPVGAAQAYFFYTGTTDLAPIYSDAGLTTRAANPASADALGQLPTLYLDESLTYRLRVVDAKGQQLGNDYDPYIPGKENAGPAGPADNTYTALATFKASDTARKSARLVSVPGVSDGNFNWTLGDYTGQADDVNIIKADSTALSVGAWVRQGAAGIYLPPANALQRPSDLAVEARRISWAERYMSPSFTPEQNAAGFLKAIEDLRSNPVTLSTDGLGGGSFTAYASGELRFGVGTFRIAANTLSLTQDLGLMLKGQGSRRTNNAILGRTTLLFVGTGSTDDFGLRTRGNGARGLTIEDLDVHYEGNGFVGDLLDFYSTPGVTINRAHIGTHGISAGTRFQTARSLVRSTYDEFLSFNDVAFDGAQYGWWSDDQRGTVGEFGGSQTNFRNVLFYDFTKSHILHYGRRTRLGLTLHTVSFNPITVGPERCLDVNNVDGLVIDGAAFTTSSGPGAPSRSWFRMINVTGRMSGCFIASGSRAGDLLGNFDFSNNAFSGSDGISLLGGVITGRGNEFSTGANGVLIAPFRTVSSVSVVAGKLRAVVPNHPYLDGMLVAIYELGGITITGNGTSAVTVIDANTIEFNDTTFTGTYTTGGKVRSGISLCSDLGPDAFKPGVTTSYYIQEPTTLARGKFNYCIEQDGSVSKFFSKSLMHRFQNVDEAAKTISIDFTANVYDCGRTYVLTKSGTQEITLPTPVHGIRLAFFRPTGDNVTITCTAGTNIYSGDTLADTAAASTSGAIGVFIEFESYGTAGWRVVAQTGVWTFT